MSDFHKKLIERLKKQENALNLDFTEEDEQAQVEEQHEDQAFSNSISSNSEDSVGESDTESIKGDNWKNYFQQNEIYEDSNGNRFNTYFVPPLNETSPIFIFHHGAGSSSMTFALLSKAIVHNMERDNNRGLQLDQTLAGIFVFDARGHGNTIMKNPAITYSLDDFTSDFSFVMDELCRRNGWTASNSPSFFLVGHSLGGSIMTSYARTSKYSIKGLAMLDIVEDTAIAALNSMVGFLNKRPKYFTTYKQAIKWHFASHLLHNDISADISVPDLFKENDGKLYWITDLYDTEPYWSTWFTDLSKNFVTARTSKLLILAGSDKLDKELMIGQMQGKYQLVVFVDSGHFLQEDVPNKTAITLIDFWKRNDRDLTKELNLPVWGKKSK